MKTLIPKLFDPNSGISTFNGEQSPAWDASSKSWHFTSSADFQNNNYSIQSYFDELSGNLKWLYSPADDYVVKINDGFEPGTFTDADFILKGCNPAKATKFENKNPQDKEVKNLKKIAKRARK
jgi:hypothetical protein